MAFSTTHRAHPVLGIPAGVPPRRLPHHRLASRHAAITAMMMTRKPVTSPASQSRLPSVQQQAGRKPYPAMAAP